MYYKDQTFCKYYKDCSLGDKCFRALTPKEHENATKWWGGENCPIMVFMEKPDCFEIKKD